MKPHDNYRGEMRIAFLTDGIYPHAIGGMQKYAYYLTRGLLEAGIGVDLYHPGGALGDAAFTDNLGPAERSRLRTVIVPFPKSLYFPGHYLYRSWKHSQATMSALLSAPQADFIYTNGFAGWALTRAKRSGVKVPPIGVNFHGLEMFQRTADHRAALRASLLRGPVRDALRGPDVVFSFGGQIREIVSQIVEPDSQIVSTANGISPEWLKEPAGEYTAPLRPRRFVFIGRYERRKGVEELGPVLRTLATADAPADFDFHFVGPIPERLRLDLHNVTYHGKLSDEGAVRAVLHEADVLVCPSYSEGMPTVILEAMACGLAVIATDVGAVSEMVDEQNGWLIPPADERALRGAMVDALAAPDARLAAKKVAGRERVEERFLWPGVVSDTVASIEDHLKKTWVAAR